MARTARRAVAMAIAAPAQREPVTRVTYRQRGRASR